MATKLRRCVNDPDKFCYISGKYILKDQRKLVTDTVTRLYFAYFSLEIRNQDKAWVPYGVWKIFNELLYDKYSGHQ